MRVCPPNGICSSIRFCRVHLCAQHSDRRSHGMCNVCSNRPHQCDASNAAYFRLFAKMATKTTSSFLSIFVFYALDLVENANKLDKCSLTLFREIWGEFKNLKKLFKRITKKIHSRIFLYFVGLTVSNFVTTD